MHRGQCKHFFETPMLRRRADSGTVACYGTHERLFYATTDTRTSGLVQGDGAAHW